MSDTTPFIAGEEMVARFITSSRWIRSDQTIRQDAFIPYPYPDLSVTRHKDLPDDELWRIGQKVAEARPTALYGRADVSVAQVRRQKLQVEARPIPENLNHACILGWPPDKPSQKSFAQELAAVARYTPKPPAC